MNEKRSCSCCYTNNITINITGTVGNNCKILSDINIPMQLY